MSRILMRLKLYLGIKETTVAFFIRTNVVFFLAVTPQPSTVKVELVHPAVSYTH